MGKLFKGALVGLASAVGAYYYKNPEDLKKHKDLVKENFKQGFSAVGDFVDEVKRQTECTSCEDGSCEVKLENEAEQVDVAREKLEELKAAYNEEPKEETHFVELKNKVEEAVDEVSTTVEEVSSAVQQEVQPVVERVEEKAQEVVETVSEVKPEEVVGSVTEKVEETVEDLSQVDVVKETTQQVEEVQSKVEEKTSSAADYFKTVGTVGQEKFSEAKDTVVEKATDVYETFTNEEKRIEFVKNVEEKFEDVRDNTKEKISEAIAAAKDSEKREQLKEEAKEKAEEVKEGAKNTLDSIVSLFSSKK